MDVKSFGRLIFIDINESFVDSPCCCDDDITVLQRHLCCRSSLRDCRDCALGIPSSIHDRNVGRGLLVETRSVDP